MINPVGGGWYILAMDNPDFYEWHPMTHEPKIMDGKMWKVPVTFETDKDRIYHGFYNPRNKLYYKDIYSAVAEVDEVTPFRWKYRRDLRA